ncbi:TPA: restriction endonuclease subunit S [Escherichia coli]|uniref:restriction endonuclease subunit S n=2 Tax=Escherichia coli TaxID=562 RepID=UPI00128F6371|nr:restriction endonuclease subunit S [Escherichia coli]EIV3236710.1 restriction endonuclease subunit S [Escherichia coli]EIV3250071.1 restriction endonuclease subunit S [Escherichia coli]EKJ3260520.1 restriction endonuclease subunit S [Escherichia coli]ELA4584721.1 restriction endonuclease subunit S [Escherichia coli]ELF7673624.1 restriction endonuclease subunit S [Escherichia coli]
MSFEIPFSHIAEIIMGQSPKGEEVNNEGIGLPLLNGPTEFTDRYPAPVQHTAYAKKISLPGDILFCVRGSTTGRMNYSDQKYCIGRGLAAIRGRNGYPTPYVKAVLETYLPKLLAAATGSTFPNVSKDLINNIPVSVLPVENACNISKLIELQEEKVFTNNQINQTLEQMAQALFKSWFVNFEPVKAKMAVLEAGGSQEDATLAAMTAISGKNADALAVFEREHPEQYAELKATAELFPSAMQDSELGDIPEGWYLQRFSNIATLHYGKALKKTERIEGPYSVYGSGGITGSHNSYLVEGPGIIVGRKGSIGTLYWEDGKFHPIDTVYYVENKEGVPLTYLYYLMGTLNLSSMNTDAAVPGLNRDNVYRLETINPEIAILNEFNNHVSALRNMIQRNKSSTETLTQLRDTLLPKLLSGEITLPEAEQAVSEVENV